MTQDPAPSKKLFPIETKEVDVLVYDAYVQHRVTRQENGGGGGGYITYFSIVQLYKTYIFLAASLQNYDQEGIFTTPFVFFFL